MSGLLDNIVTGASQTVSDVSFGLYTPAVTQGSSTTDPFLQGKHYGVIVWSF